MKTRSILDEEWQLLASFLPQDWRELARAQGAIRRERGVTDPDALLRLLFLHVATGLFFTAGRRQSDSTGVAIDVRCGAPKKTSVLGVMASSTCIQDVLGEQVRRAQT